MITYDNPNRNSIARTINKKVDYSKKELVDNYINNKKYLLPPFVVGSSLFVPFKVVQLVVIATSLYEYRHDFFSLVRDVHAMVNKEKGSSKSVLSSALSHHQPFVDYADERGLFVPPSPVDPQLTSVLLETGEDTNTYLLTWAREYESG